MTGPIVGSELPVWSIHGATESYVSARDVFAANSRSSDTVAVKLFHHDRFDNNAKRTKWVGWDDKSEYSYR